MKKTLRKILELPNHLHNRFVFAYRNITAQSFPKIAGKLSVRGAGSLSFGKGVIITSGFNRNPIGLGIKTAFHIARPAKIEIGNKVGISNSLFFALEKITIEDNVLIGGGCQFLDADFHSLSYEERVLGGDKQKNSRPILVKEGAFIGAACMIMKGVTIGTRSIVAAGSVVVKDIPSGEIWGGNPAKFIKKTL